MNMRTLDKGYLDNKMEELVQVVGIRQPLQAERFYEEAGRSVKRANKVILTHLGIKNRVSVAFVDDCALPYDQELVGRPCRPGRILLPDKLIVGHRLVPFKAEMDVWKSPIAKRIPVRVEIDERYRADLHAMGAILAHEDTHLFLRLLRYEADEEMVDVAAIILGLGMLMANGRNRPRGGFVTERIGYLDEESFNYVRRRVMQVSPQAMKGGVRMAKVKCPNCGFENEEGLQFCTQCSTELTGIAPVEEEQVSAAEASAPVSAEETPRGTEPATAVKARLVVKRTGRVGQEFAIDQESMNVGRWDADSGALPEIDLSDDDPGGHISRRHAKIFVKKGEYFIEDMGSTNGTFVNKGPRLTPGSPQKLQNGDEVVMGRTFFTFVLE